MERKGHQANENASFAASGIWVLVLPELGNKKKKSRVCIWRFDNLSSLYFRPTILAIKKIGILCGNQWKVVNHTGCQKQIIVQHPEYFWPFLKTRQKN